MDCTNAQTLIDSYMDGELDLVRNLEIEDHLPGCALCSQRCIQFSSVADAQRGRR
jgi:hypothetical protein